MFSVYAEQHVDQQMPEPEPEPVAAEPAAPVDYSAYNHSNPTSFGSGEQSSSSDDDEDKI